MTADYDPLKEYQRRMGTRMSDLSRLKAWDEKVANARLIVFLLGLIVAWLAFRERSLSPSWLAAPAILFVGMLVAHDRLLRAMDRVKNGVAYYERGIARIENRWMGGGWDGAELAPPDHPNVNDLDIFGPGSLFQRLCTTQTRAGGMTLAGWLCDSAAPDEILARQEAVEELRHCIDLREELNYQGRTMRSKVYPEAMSAWVAAPALFRSGLLVITACAVSLFSLLSLTLILLEVSALPFFLAIIALTLMHLATRKEVSAVFAAVEEPGNELETVGKVLARLEQERFNSPWLKSVQASFLEGTPPAPAAIGQLRRLHSMREASLNQLFAPFAALLMWNYHVARAMDAWRTTHGPSIARWLDGVGRLEALCALAAYAYEAPDYPFPRILGNGPHFIGEGLGHPLLPADQCVRNDVRLDAQQRLLIVSGSNMSGKSVLLRSVGINLVLGGAGAPVCARALAFSPLKLGATINVHDAIQTGVSRFYAEIKRIKLLMDIAKGPTPLLFLLDEIMHGTNSWDRCIGSKAILEGLVKTGAIGLVTTHDLAITNLAEAFDGRATNVHFEDQLEGGRLVFDYKLRPGVVTKSNALDLMRAIGLEVE